MAFSEVQIEALTTAITELTKALKPVKQLADALAAEKERLAVHNSASTRYEPSETGDLVDEATMAEKLHIPKRTLGEYRRQGRLPGCSIKNSKRIRWRVTETLDARQRGMG